MNATPRLNLDHLLKEIQEKYQLLGNLNYAGEKFLKTYAEYLDIAEKIEKTSQLDEVHNFSSPKYYIYIVIITTVKTISDTIEEYINTDTNELSTLKLQLITALKSLSHLEIQSELEKSKFIEAKKLFYKFMSVANKIVPTIDEDPDLFKNLEKIYENYEPKLIILTEEIQKAQEFNLYGSIKSLEKTTFGLSDPLKLLAGKKILKEELTNPRFSKKMFMDLVEPIQRKIEPFIILPNNFVGIKKLEICKEILDVYPDLKLVFEEKTNLIKLVGIKKIEEIILSLESDQTTIVIKNVLARHNLEQNLNGLLTSFKNKFLVQSKSSFNNANMKKQVKNIVSEINRSIKEKNDFDFILVSTKSVKKDSSKFILRFNLELEKTAG